MRQTPAAGQILGLGESRGVKERPDWLAGAVPEHVFAVSPTNQRRCGDTHRKTPASSMGEAYVNPWQGRLTGNLIYSNLISMWGENQGPEFRYKNQVETYRGKEYGGSVPERDVEHSVLQLFSPKSSFLAYLLELSHCSVSVISRVVSSPSHWQLRS